MLMQFSAPSQSLSARSAVQNSLNLPVLLTIQLVDRARPIFFQEPRERAVGEQTSFRLAARTVVRLVVRITNALHGRAAHGTGQTIASVDGHTFAKGGHFLG